MTHEILHLSNCFHRVWCTTVHYIGANDELFICLVRPVTTLRATDWRCCSAFFNTEISAGGIKPALWGLLPKLCQTAPYGFTTRLRQFKAEPLNADPAIHNDPGRSVFEAPRTPEYRPQNTQ